MHQGIVLYFSVLSKEALKKMEIIKAVATVSLLFYIKFLATKKKKKQLSFQAEKKKSDPQITQSGSSNTH